MPEKKTMARVRAARRRGKSADSQAGEFVREEIHHVREGKHGARSAKQAIAIGLSKARRAGVDVPPPPKRRSSKKTRRAAARATAAGRRGTRRTNPRRAKSTLRALRKESRRSASHTALSRQAHRQSRQRTAKERSASARKAARTRARR